MKGIQLWAAVPLREANSILCSMKKLRATGEKKDNILHTINNHISEVNFKNTTISQEMRKAVNQ